MFKGTVKWFNIRKGYGFITPSDGSEDIFVHYSALVSIEREYKTLYEGDKVEYNLADGQKGKQASDVKIVEKAPHPIRNIKGSKKSQKRNQFFTQQENKE
jgi:cold shock protein